MGAFSRDNKIERKRFRKQQGLCALCDKRLCYENLHPDQPGAWQAHHIDGNPDNNTMRNCAAVCIGGVERCHVMLAHGGNTRTGPLAPRRMYILTRPPRR